MKDFEDELIPIEERIELERTKIFMKGKGTKVNKEGLIKMWERLDKIAEKEEKRLLKLMSAKDKKKKSK